MSPASFESSCVVVAGPSGSGKSSLIARVIELDPEWIFSVSATTRPQRPGEVDGREYHFVDQVSFEQMVVRGEFLEYAEVYGNSYGTPASELARAAQAGKHLLIEVDTVGCLSIRALRPEFPLVAILPPGVPELKRRLRMRGTESEDSLARRFSNIVAELQRMRGFDYAIVNDDLDQATGEMLTLLKVVKAGLHRTTPRVDRVLASAGGTYETP